MLVQCNVRTLLPSIRLANYVRHGHQLFRPVSSRRFSSDIQEENKNISSVTTSRSEGASATKRSVGLTDHRVTSFGKYLLVWSGHYKTINEVPDYVSQDVISRSRNKARIKINLMMVAATIFVCILMIISGKKAAREGQSVSKMNQDWHKEINEEHRRKVAAENS